MDESSREEVARLRALPPLPPLPPALPEPGVEGVDWFAGWHERRFGVALPPDLARDAFRHILQFYFLTRGHEHSRPAGAASPGDGPVGRSV